MASNRSSKSLRMWFRNHSKINTLGYHLSFQNRKHYKNSMEPDVHVSTHAFRTRNMSAPTLLSLPDGTTRDILPDNISVYKYSNCIPCWLPTDKPALILTCPCPSPAFHLFAQTILTSLFHYLSPNLIPRAPTHSFHRLTHLFNLPARYKYLFNFFRESAKQISRPVQSIEGKCQRRSTPASAS